MRAKTGAVSVGYLRYRVQAFRQQRYSDALHL